MAKKSINGVKIVCSECGSDDIMEKSWFNPNTGESFGWDESNECYCKRCGRLTQWKEVRPTIEKKNTAYLVFISPIVRVVVEEEETIAETHEKAIRMAIDKILANPDEYIHEENVEEVFEDTECPARNDELTISDLNVLAELKERLENENDSIEYTEC